MKNPVTVLWLPQPKEMSLERGLLRALLVRRGRKMSITVREADLLNLAAGSVGYWGHEFQEGPTVSQATEVAPLLGDGAWRNFMGTFP